ncbi:MAG: helix-turn-helix domain-containing protein, partial [Desulfohalobiaceae bacterium]
MLEFKASTLARAFRVHRNTVRNWIKSGKLQAQPTVGKRYLIQPQDLARFCAREGVPASWAREIIPQEEFLRFCELLQEITGEVNMQKPVGAVLVAGGGVAGIQAALDLAES